MSRRRWFFHVVIRSLAHRKGGTLLLVTVLAMASSLVTSLGIVSFSMEKKVAEEIRRYGANLVIVADSAGVEVGSGGMNFGRVAESAYLDQGQVQRALLQEPAAGRDLSFHLRGALKLWGDTVAVDGVVFPQIRRLSPWWRIQGTWPDANGALIGSDLALRRSIKPGDALSLSGPAGGMVVRVTGIVSTGGEADRLVFLDLLALQKALGLQGQLTAVKILAAATGEDLRRLAGNLQKLLGGAQVKEVRQVAATSESLLKKVQLLMLLVAAVVVTACGASVAATMSSSVLERGREIGLIKAMGASRRAVLLLFTAESVLLGIIGGVAGYGAGYAIALLVTKTVFATAAEFLPAFFPAAVVVSCFLALVGSTGPLIAVYRLDPVRSLRGE
ncbi:ABC transporter permease [Geotalea sp. SG265]|uniref:ABC transporter permease n=1 Tax=Geotalea sp. SG265 TaxID=2922867 RepID=UPI001FAFB46D|nr:ABC transporter permease [Geotalea sp. SG265]